MSDMTKIVIFTVDQFALETELGLYFIIILPDIVKNHYM